MNEYLELISTIIHTWAAGAVLVLAFVVVWFSIPYLISFALWVEEIDRTRK
jgi:membrane protein YdbS with pleckstrin-like domain